MINIGNANNRNNDDSVQVLDAVRHGFLRNSYPDASVKIPPSSNFCFFGSSNRWSMGNGKQRMKKSVVMFMTDMNKLTSVRHFGLIRLTGLQGPVAVIVITSE